MRIALTADHNGVEAKTALARWLVEHAHEVDDLGVHDSRNVVDYPPLCVDVCRRVLDGSAARGVVVGGTGGGEIIVCNRLAGIRAALGQTPEVARISRANNDSNVLVLGAKVLSISTMQAVLEMWLATAFSEGRHRHRLNQIEALERGQSLT